HLDTVMLAMPSVDRPALEHEWSARTQPITLHLDVIDGTYVPSVWDDGGGPDDFELEIGNHIAYSVPLWEGSDAYRSFARALAPLLRGRAAFIPARDGSRRVP